MERCSIVFIGSELLITGGVQAQSHIKLREQGTLSPAGDEPKFRALDCGHPASGHQPLGQRMCTNSSCPIHSRGQAYASDCSPCLQLAGSASSISNAACHQPSDRPLAARVCCLVKALIKINLIFTTAPSIFCPVGTQGSLYFCLLSAYFLWP